jgi:hypothetical protein
MALFPIGIVLILAFVYSNTIALDLTWAHLSADGGDLIAAAATGGIPHPSGYPLYLILERSFLYLPAGTLAFRTNLLSSVCTILACLLLYKYLVVQFQGRTIQHFVAFLAAISYGLAPFVWGQALVTEVYALHGLLLIACIYVLSMEDNSVKGWVCGLVFGVAATNHATVITLFPLLLLDHQKKLLLPFRSILQRAIGVTIGLSPYLLLPLRASVDPPVNWGDASTLSGFLWLISGRIYQPYWFSLTGPEMIQRFRAFAGLLLEQFAWAGVLLGIYGLLSKHPRRVFIPTIWMGMVFLFISIFYGSRDSQVNLIPFWLAFSIWLAYGLQDMLAIFREDSRLQWILPGLYLVVIMIHFPSSLIRNDLTNDSQARDFINTSIEKLPQRSIVFVEGDEQTFSLWFAQFAEHQRLDIVIIVDDLLPYDWYTENLQRNYPGLKIPQSDQIHSLDLIAANLGRVVCYIGPNKSLYCL